MSFPSSDAWVTFFGYSPFPPRSRNLVLQSEENIFMRMPGIPTVAAAIATAIAASVIVACLSAGNAARAQTPDKISFGTNWVAEAEHGGFYQALSDGTYRKHGLDVTIVQGGPQVNNQLMLAVVRLDFAMSANTLQSFDAVAQNIP